LEPGVGMVEEPVMGSQVLGIREPVAGMRGPAADRPEPAIRAVVGSQAVEGSLAGVGMLGPGQARLGRVVVGVAAYLPSLNLPGLLFSRFSGRSLDQELLLEQIFLVFAVN